MGVERSELLAGTRSLPIESHTLFYRVTLDMVEIIRVRLARERAKPRMAWPSS
jgi:toxin ParE1/3/4